MNEFNQAPHPMRTLNDAEIDTVSGGEVKITGQAYIPFAGTFLWSDNGNMAFMGDDFWVAHSRDYP